ncbi:MAG: hypothetical protein WAT39_19675 [Planctomycetota bacterium]
MPKFNTTAAWTLLAATNLASQDTTPPPCDRNTIQWVLPGDFRQALARANREQRMLVIKGISFGVDTEGARCATKGVW